MSIKDSKELEFAFFVLKMLREGCSDMHCMSEQYLSKELSEEYERK